MLAADSDFQLRPGLPSPLHSDFNQLADSFLIENLEGIVLQNALVDVNGQELPGVVP